MVSFLMFTHWLTVIFANVSLIISLLRLRQDNFMPMDLCKCMKLIIFFIFLGIALSVKIEMDEKVHHLKEEIVELKTQLEHYKNRCKEQEVMADI